MARHFVMGFTCHLIFTTTYKVDIIKKGICVDEETTSKELRKSGSALHDMAEKHGKIGVLNPAF